MKFKRKKPDKSGSQQKKDTRFKKGQSGNPAGRKAGSRNKATIILDNMLQGEAEAILNKAIKLALKGDSQMIRALLDKLIPNRKDSPVKIRLPTATAAKDLPAITGAILKAAGTGKVTPSEAAALSKIIDSHKSALELFEIEARLQHLENKMGDKKMSRNTDKRLSNLEKQFYIDTDGNKKGIFFRTVDCSKRDPAPPAPVVGWKHKGHAIVRQPGEKDTALQARVIETVQPFLRPGQVPSFFSITDNQ